ncbi:hypothetical protein X975_19953, partial [Stegodyphus mimosarum]
MFLQTLLINVDVNKRQKTVRALIDTGSQRSYILKETAADIGCRAIGSKFLTHALLGGITRRREIDNRYEVNAGSLKGDFSRQLILLEQSKICGPVVSLQPGPWIEELKQKNIHTSDINDKEELPSNREVPEERLLSTTKKFVLKDKFETYNAVFEEWLESREEVPEDEERVENHHLPHRLVFKDNCTTAVRNVFDASCKQKDFLSLNDCVAKGKNLIELIPRLLLEFRQGKIGVISDIRKAFLQISVQINDCDFLRFLWWKNSEQKEIRKFRHCRLVFELKCSSFLLGAVIDSHLDECESSLKEVATKLKNSFYVDNCVISVNSNEEAE